MNNQNKRLHKIRLVLSLVLKSEEKSAVYSTKIQSVSWSNLKLMLNILYKSTKQKLQKPLIN